MEIVFLLVGLVLGFLISFLLMQMLRSKQTDADIKIDQLHRELEENKTTIQIEAAYTNSLKEQLVEVRTEFQHERASAMSLNAMLAASKSDFANLQDKLDTQKQEMESLQKQAAAHFNNLANTILEEKTQKFTRQNKENMDMVLQPLNQKLKDFEKKVEDTYINNVKDRTDLQAEIKKLYDLNAKISEEATNLTKALKGDMKKQGNWGEVILERILENSGLEKGREYKTQVSLSNSLGKKYQPDVVIYLPENKNIVIDAKVSLVAYEKLVNAQSNEDQDAYLKLHIDSLKSHIKELSDKQYYSLETLNSPEYVLMFLPIESSFSIAIKEDTRLFNHAWDNKIVIVSPSTLIATLLTISSIWRQENQTRNAIEIAKKSGDLYDKFVGLINDLQDVGNKLKQTQKSYEASMNKLSEGKGNLVRRAEELKNLGAKTSKSLPQSFIDRAEE